MSKLSPFTTLFTKNPQSKSKLLNAFYLMKDALEGRVPPIFYVFPIDTGLGKTTLIKHFLRFWKAEGFRPGGGILLALNTKAEISEFANSCGLDAIDYAAFTSDEDINKLGATTDHADRVPVLFTTHAMLRARLRNKGFTSAREFFFRGSPRALRLWDERALRAEPIHITLDDLVKLLGPTRPYRTEWAEGLESFINLAKRVPVGTVLKVPKRFGTGQQFAAADGVAPILTATDLGIYKQLKAAQGNKVRVCSGKKYGNTLVGSGDPLPADLAPMFIFDASARIGNAYELWGEKDAVAIMPPLVRDYRNLVVRIWKTACGRTALEDTDKRSRLLAGIARTLNLDPKPTLLIGSKARASLFDLQGGLREYLDQPDDLRFRHWGVHYGTNEFAAMKRLVVIGAYRNRDTSDQAIYMAASGADPATVAGDEWIAIARQGMQQNLLQAFSRGNLRNGIDGQCGECVIYLIAPPTPDPEALVRDTFPGCQIEAWEPYGTVLKGQAKAVFDALDTMVKAGRVGNVPKFEIRESVVIASPSRFAQVLANPSLVNALKSIGVTWTKANFVIARNPTNVVSLAEILRNRIDRCEDLSLVA